MEKRTGRQWVELWQASGLSKSAFCREHELPYWKLSGQKQTKPVSEKLIEVKIPAVTRRDYVAFNLSLGFAELNFHLKIS